MGIGTVMATRSCARRAGCGNHSGGWLERADSAAPIGIRRRRAAIVPFRIQVPDAVLRDLKSRLERARFADEFSDAGWDYGTNLNYIQSLMTYWRDRYDWRAQERR